MIEFRWLQPKDSNMPPKLQYRFKDTHYHKDTWWTPWIDIPTVMEE